MKTDEVLAVIANAKRRADVVPAIVEVFTEDRGVDFALIKISSEAKWSEAGYVWILRQAWKIIDAMEEVQP